MAKYRWGDGKGKVHSISLGQHKKNVRVQKKAKRRQADLDKVTAPKGMSDILRDSNTASSLRYGGEERALGLQQAQVPAWFAAHRAQVAGIAQGVNAGYQKAVDEQRAAVQAQQTTATTQQAAAGKSSQADAEKRGATADPGVQQQALAGANVNAQAGNDMVGLLAAQQTAQGGYYGGLQAASSAAELSQKGRVASDQRALQADKGLYRSQYVSDARDKEHTKVLERQAYGLDVAKAANDAADDRADNRRDRQQTRRTNMEKDRQYRLDKAKLGDDRAKDAYQKRNKLGPYKPAATPKDPNARTPAERRQANVRIQKAADLWGVEADTKYDFGTDDKPNVRTPTPDEIKAKLIRKGYTSAEIRKAIARIKKNRPAKKKSAKPTLPKTVLNPFD
jgi:hypothetical protein